MTNEPKNESCNVTMNFPSNNSLTLLACHLKSPERPRAAFFSQAMPSKDTRNKLHMLLRGIAFIHGAEELATFSLPLTADCYLTDCKSRL